MDILLWHLFKLVLCGSTHRLDQIKRTMRRRTMPGVSKLFVGAVQFRQYEPTGGRGIVAGGILGENKPITTLLSKLLCHHLVVNVVNE